jgi:hypothetical protein
MDETETEHATYTPGLWMADPRPSLAVVGTSSGTHYYIDQREVAEEEYRIVSVAQREADREARREREFESAEDAFNYAALLNDGIVLDWGYCYSAMEREGLKIGFVIEEDEQPIVTPADLLTQPGTNYILVRFGKGQGIGACCTNFSDDRLSWAEDECEVLADGAGRYEKGRRLIVRVSPNFGARSSVGRNWRMKFLNPTDVMAVLG